MMDCILSKISGASKIRAPVFLKIVNLKQKRNQSETRPNATPYTATTERIARDVTEARAVGHDMTDRQSSTWGQKCVPFA